MTTPRWVTSSPTSGPVPRPRRWSRVASCGPSCRTCWTRSTPARRPWSACVTGSTAASRRRSTKSAGRSSSPGSGSGRSSARPWPSCGILRARRCCGTTSRTDQPHAGFAPVPYRPGPAPGRYHALGAAGAPLETPVQEMSMSHHSDLIDTTEMYLRTVYELEEEGVTPLRARIAERLGQSGPTVSQTVARMERDGLLHVADDRHLELTDAGRHEAIGVMRKHRLAERLLADVIGLDWEDLHIEACRWEHVMSEKVERRILALLDKPLVCPHGNPIPGLDQLGLPFATDQSGPLLSLSEAVAEAPSEVVISRISEQLQPDAGLMHRLDEAGMRPGHRVHVTGGPQGVEVWPEGGEHVNFDRVVADHVFVRVV